MISHRLLTLALPLALAAFAPAQNCSQTSIGATPLLDLGLGRYQGFTGGLYPDGANVPPAAHAALGQTATQAVQPLNALGQPSPTGRIGLISIGMSNASQEFSEWVPISNGDPERNAAVRVVDAAVPGMPASTMSTPTAPYWNEVDRRLGVAGLSAEQVQVVWLKNAMRRPTAPFPEHAQQLQGLLGDIVQILGQRFPNLQICYLASRIYAGYATITLNPESFAYESGFSVKWLIQQQIDGDPAFAYDPRSGVGNAPWLAWGPYLWADGLRPRSDGLIWRCIDFEPDGTHPSLAGERKVAAALDAHFRSDVTATPWYLTGGGGVQAAITFVGAGCPGVAGALLETTVSTPFLGNPEFVLGARNARASSPAFALLGNGGLPIPIQGCTLHLDPTAPFVTLSASTDAAGRVRTIFPVPVLPALSGARVMAQWLVLDAAAPGLQPLLGGAAMTRGYDLLFGRR
ncbi:MAG: hypothetical protein AAF628_23910 [Planctomycetota bacterium]